MLWPDDYNEFKIKKVLHLDPDNISYFAVILIDHPLQILNRLRYVIYKIFSACQISFMNFQVVYEQYIVNLFHSFE